LGSADLKKMPPMPVTRFIVFLLQSTRARSAVQRLAVQRRAVGLGEHANAVTVYGFRTAAAHLPPLKVQRDEGQDAQPDLVPLRGHVQPNEGCTPRELNALKPHRCCRVKALRAVWQIAADSFATGGNSSLAQTQSHD
jgi:hypothetical protein